MRITIKLVTLAAAALAFASGLSPSVPGQRTDAERIERALREDRERRARDNEMRERAYDLRLAGKVYRQPERREPKLAVAQIREDFVRIQIVNNDLAQAVSRRGGLDLKVIANQASEIKKRAGRLKENLVLPEIEEVFERSRPEEAGAEAGQLKSSLHTLDRLILEFVNNPIFKEAHIVDVQLSAKARRDLEDIIEVSDRVKKSSEKLKKFTQKIQ